MATRSRIAIENGDGTVRSIYCHWDGYPSNNGRLLKSHYRDRKKVEELIALGDISYLAPELRANGPHSFESPADGVVVAYHRDRGEDYNAPEETSSIAAFAKSDIEEYGYVFTKEGQWLFIDGHKNSAGRRPVPLEEVI